MRFQLDRYASPISEILLVTDEQGRLRALDFAGHEARMHRLLREHYGSFVLEPGAAPLAIRRALDAYFGGQTAALEEIETATKGTEFQREVWRGLRKIPAGTTRSYGELAAALGRPKASRAVGAANGANPIAIVVPCHRVIGANGSLTGFASGLERKKWLLSHEAAFAVANHAGALARTGSLQLGRGKWQV